MQKERQSNKKNKCNKELKNIIHNWKNVKNFHSWTKSHKTQSQAKFELGLLLFLLKEGEKIVESWNPNHLKP
jgi:hypothetical protein